VTDQSISVHHDIYGDPAPARVTFKVNPPESILQAWAPAESLLRQTVP
jgi:hypothetical protein